MTSTPNNTSNYGSLLDDPSIGPIDIHVPKPPRWDRRLDDAIRRRSKSWWNNPKQRKYLLSLFGMLVIGGAVGAYFVFRPVPLPDFTTANVDVLFNYTLLTEEFNSLPIEERLELIAQLVDRLKSIDGEQSLLMALFAAQIQGEVRKQFERNASLLAVDLFDSYAEDFDQSLPVEDRDAFVESKFIEFQKTLERVAGEENEMSDEERLIQGRKQAKRDLEFAQSGGLPVGNAVRMLTFVNRSVGTQASGHQKIRINGFVSQMVRTLREGEVPQEEEPAPSRRSQAAPVEQSEQAPAQSPEDDSADRSDDETPAEPELVAPDEEDEEKDSADADEPKDAEKKPADEPGASDDDDGGGP
jgi:hypothetical protein